MSSSWKESMAASRGHSSQSRMAGALRERTDSCPQVLTHKAHPQWHNSSSKAIPPKPPKPNSTTDWGPCVPNNWARGRHSFETPQKSSWKKCITAGKSLKGVAGFQDSSPTLSVALRTACSLPLCSASLHAQKQVSLVTMNWKLWSQEPNIKICYVKLFFLEILCSWNKAKQNIFQLRGCARKIIQNIDSQPVDLNPLGGVKWPFHRVA